MRLRLLLISMLTFVVCSSVKAKEVFTVDGITYVTYYSSRFSAVYVTEKEDGSKYAGNLTIPNKISYQGKEYYVAGIGDNAFKDCTALTSVNKEGIIDFIGNSAFEGCTGLTELTIPQYYSDNMYEGYITVGYRAFWGCHLNTLTCKVGTPPTFEYSNPSNSISGVIPTSADWIGWYYNDHWSYSNHTTLYVPAGCIGAYKQKDDSWYQWNWSDFFTDIKEFGIEEDDPVPTLYEEADKLKNICAHLNDSIKQYSDVYYFLVDSLVKDAIVNGDSVSVEQIFAQLHDYFTWVMVEGNYYDGNNGGYEFPYIPELYNIISMLNNNIETAEKELEELQESRKEYYRGLDELEKLQSLLANAQDETDKANIQQVIDMHMQIINRLKSEWMNKADNASELLKQVASSIEEIYSSNILQEKTDEFVVNLMATISGISSVEADRSFSKIWYTLDGRRLLQQPTKTGIYINNGKKVFVK